MDEIIQTLRSGKWALTLHDMGGTTCEFVLAVSLKEIADLWYLAQFCAENHLDVGAPYYLPNRGVAYFPRLLVGAKHYEAIINDPR